MDKIRIMILLPLLTLASMALMAAASSAAWNFNEAQGSTVFDVTGNGHNGVISGMGNADDAGKRVKSGRFQGALSFNGKEDYADLGNDTFGLELTSQFTISCWVQFRSPLKGSQIIVQKGQFIYPFLLILEGNKIKAGIRTGTGVYLYSRAVIREEQWYYLTLTYREPDFILYIDGAEDAKVKAEGQLAVSSIHNTYAGGMPDKKGVLSPANMLLDYLSIYNTALTAREIAAGYAEKSDVPDPDFTPAPPFDPAEYTAAPGAYAYNKEYSLTVAREARDALRLDWKAVSGITEYVVLRGNTPGYSGKVKLAGDAKKGDTVLLLETTNGLQPGAEFHFGEGRDVFTITEITAPGRVKISAPAPAAFKAQNSVLSLSGCWIKDYPGYRAVRWIKAGEKCTWVNRSLLTDTDYFYTIAFLRQDTIAAFANPVHALLTDEALLYDAALGINGGYAWKNDQLYSDTPGLIDGNRNTSQIRIQVSNPEISLAGNTWRGFHRVNLNQCLPVKRIVISQNNSAARVKAAVVQLGFDDRTALTFNLESDPAVTRHDQAVENTAYRVYTIPVDKQTSYVDFFVEAAADTTKPYIEWNKLGVYTDQAVSDPVTSAGALRTVDMKIDFSQADGTLPAIFGTDEIFVDVSGSETGWMLTTWPYTSPLFNLYRVQMGDSWPRGYGFDILKVGELADDITATATGFNLKNKHPYLDALDVYNKLKIGSELMKFSVVKGNTLTVSGRGLEYTVPRGYKAGTPVYTYKNAGQVMRLSEILPEFKVARYFNAYVSGITPIDSTIDENAPLRTATLTLTLQAGEYKAGDIIRVGREMFHVVKTAREQGKAQRQLVTVERGFDGTNQRFIQHNYPPPDVYKIADYEPYYRDFKNDAADYNNYYWDDFRLSMDKIITEGGAVPWIIVYSPVYATNTRGRVKKLETASNPREIKNSIIVDEYNRAHDDADFWFYLNPANKDLLDLNIRGNMYQYYHAELHMLTGKAAGRVYFVRAHNADSLALVRTWDDSTWTSQNPQFIDLYAEGVREGDAYLITHGASKMLPNVTRRFWQYNARLFYNVARFIRENYRQQLKTKPIYMEYYIEPNLGTYGTWTLDAYIDSYNVLAKTIRQGSPGLGKGFGKEEVLLGAGAIAGGLNPAVQIPGANEDYGLALALVKRADPVDFISHHRYYMGSRVQKRENSWEYRMIRSYASSLGKEIFIVDSEDSVATAGGTGNEQAIHQAKYAVPYWHANFINSYYGDFGAEGRLAFIIHFRLYFNNISGSGMASRDAGGKPVLSNVYWPIKLYLDRTSRDPAHPDNLARVIKGWDNYGWVQLMGTTHGVTGRRYLHLVNKKDTAVTVNLEVLGVKQPVSGRMDSVIGSGPRQSLGDGYQPPDLKGAVVTETIADFSRIRLEPHSTNIIELAGE